MLPSRLSRFTTEAIVHFLVLIFSALTLFSACSSNTGKLSSDAGNQDTNNNAASDVNANVGHDPICATLADADACTQAGCTWEGPGCDPPPGYVQGYCRSNSRLSCSGNDDCDEGQRCLPAWVDACADSDCEACGGEASACMPEERTPVPIAPYTPTCTIPVVSGAGNVLVEYARQEGTQIEVSVLWIDGRIEHFDDYDGESQTTVTQAAGGADRVTTLQEDIAATGVQALAEGCYEAVGYEGFRETMLLQGDVGFMRFALEETAEDAEPLERTLELVREYILEAE